jgi:hypothetical protein
MTAHVPQETLARLSTGELEPAEVAAILRHIEGCDDCAATARASEERTEHAVRSWLASSAPESHLDFDSQIVPFIRGRLSAADREIVESHLDDCATCVSEVGDLRRMLAHPRRRRRNALAVAAAAGAAVWLGIVIARNASVEPTRPADEISERPIVAATVEPGPGPSLEPPRPRYEDPAWQQLLDDALKTGKLPFPASLDALQGREDPLRGPDSRGTGDLAPAGVVLDDQRPRLTWQAREGARYTVSIFDGDVTVARSESLERNEWLPDRRLPRGRTYIWQVEVVRDGKKEVLPAPPAPPATFGIASEKDHRELALARRRHPQDHLLHALLAARAGLRAEALAALRRIETPEDPEVQRLLRAYGDRSR